MHLTNKDTGVRVASGGDVAEVLSVNVFCVSPLSGVFCFFFGVGAQGAFSGRVRRLQIR